jgi:hypothetical protein
VARHRVDSEGSDCGVRRLEGWLGSMPDIVEDSTALTSITTMSAGAAASPVPRATPPRTRTISSPSWPRSRQACAGDRRRGRTQPAGGGMPAGLSTHSHPQHLTHHRLRVEPVLTMRPVAIPAERGRLWAAIVRRDAITAGYSLADPPPHLLISASARSSQNTISIWRYIVVAVVRCSWASRRLSVRR